MQHKTNFRTIKNVNKRQNPVKMKTKSEEIRKKGQNNRNEKEIREYEKEIDKYWENMITLPKGSGERRNYVLGLPEYAQVEIWYRIQQNQRGELDDE